MIASKRTEVKGGGEGPSRAQFQAASKGASAGRLGLGGSIRLSVDCAAEWRRGGLFIPTDWRIEGIKVLLLRLALMERDAPSKQILSF